MSEDFEYLRELGIDKIHKDTRIIKHQLEAILNEDFDHINKVQMFGFLSIIEREYHLDLTELKNDAKEHYSKDISDEDTGVFVIASKNKQSSFLYILLILIVFVTVAFFTLDQPSKNVVVSSENKIIEEVKKNINLVKADKKEPIAPIIEKTVARKVLLEKKEELVQKKEVKKVELDFKVETVKDQMVVEKKKEAVVKVSKSSQKQSFVLLPKSKVWVGYINITENKKYQKVVKEELIFDIKQEWLLILGHSNVNIVLDGKKIFYKNRKSLRLWYKNGKLKEVSLEEFKKINRGKKW